MKRTAQYFLLFILLIVLAGCSNKFKMPREAIGESSEWAYYKYNIESGGARPGTFSGKLDVVWENSFRNKLSGPLTISNGFLIFPGSKRKIEIFETATGLSRGYVRSKRHPQSGMIIQDSLGFFFEAPRLSRLRCVNLLNKKKIWDSKIKDATAGLIIVDSFLIVSSSEGSIYALNIKTGETGWVYHSEKRLAAPPSSNGDLIVQTTDGGSLLALSASDGEEVFVIEIEAPVLGSAAIDDKVYLADYSGNVYALELDSGEVVWKNKLNARFWAAPALSDGVLFLGSTDGKFYALNSDNGEIVWEFSPGDVIRSSPIVVGDYVLFGTMSGILYSLRAEDGLIASRRELSGSILFSPVSDGRHIFVATTKGELLCLGSTLETASIK
ncbi:MAG: PQQ-binding-like beta-propeller repeat protein [candidate division Zixibacteria bacterium]